MLGIGDVGDRLAAKFDAIAGGAVRMVERPGAQGDAGARVQHLAVAESLNDTWVLSSDNRHREERRHHHAAEHVLEAVIGQQVTGPETDLVAAHIGGAENGRPQICRNACGYRRDRR